jgi:hypothetical protein
MDPKNFYRSSRQKDLSPDTQQIPKDLIRSLTNANTSLNWVCMSLMSIKKGCRTLRHKMKKLYKKMCDAKWKVMNRSKDILFNTYLSLEIIIHSGLIHIRGKKINIEVIKVAIYSIAYNENLLLPYFVAHYRSRFPGCNITIYDNCSTDNTARLASNLGCIVKQYDSCGRFCEDKQIEIKNNCWKGTDADWVIVCDIDEFLDADLAQLMEERCTILRTQGWDMVGGKTKESFDFYAINHGIKNNLESKHIAFKPQEIAQINYAPGAHSCTPVGNVHYSYRVYNLYHYKYIYLDYVIARHKMSAERLSSINREMGWGAHYLIEEDRVYEIYEKYKKNMQKLF